MPGCSDSFAIAGGTHPAKGGNMGLARKLRPLWQPLRQTILLCYALRVGYAHPPQAVFTRKKALVGGRTIDEPMLYQYCRQVVVSAVTQHRQVIGSAAVCIIGGG